MLKVHKCEPTLDKLYQIYKEVNDPDKMYAINSQIKRREKIEATSRLQRQAYHIVTDNLNA